MKANMGNLDKGIRITIAIVIAILYFTNMISGLNDTFLFGIAVIFIL